MTFNLNKLIKFTFIIVTLLAIGNLISTNVLATGGHELESVLTETETLRKDNFYLNNQIAQATSIANLEKKAYESGFVQINETLAITTPAPVAYVAQ